MKSDLIFKEGSTYGVHNGQLLQLENNAKLYRWFEYKEYRDAFIQGELRFSSPLWLRLGHDMKEYRFNDGQVHASFGGAYALCLTKNNTPTFWKERYNWKKAYGVKINTENFFYSVKNSLLDFNSPTNTSSKAFVELMRKADLIEKLGLPPDFTRLHVHSKLDSNRILNEKEDLLSIAFKDHHPLYDSEQFNSTISSFTGYPIAYYEPEKTNGLGLLEKEALCLKKTNSFTNENEYRISLSLAPGSKGFDKIIKFVVINCSLNSEAIEEVYDDVN